MVSCRFVLDFAEWMAVAPDCCCQKRMASWSQPSSAKIQNLLIITKSKRQKCEQQLADALSLRVKDLFEPIELNL